MMQRRDSTQIMLRNGLRIRWIEIIDASGDGFLFTDWGGAWHAFGSSDDPPKGATAIQVRVPFELDKDDPDNELLAVLLAKRFVEAEASGRPLSQKEIDQTAARAKGLVDNLSETEKDALRDGEDLNEASEADAEGLSTEETIAVVGVVALLGGLAWAVTRDKKKKR